MITTSCLKNTAYPYPRNEFRPWSMVVIEDFINCHFPLMRDNKIGISSSALSYTELLPEVLFCSANFFDTRVEIERKKENSCLIRTLRDGMFFNGLNYGLPDRLWQEYSLSSPIWKYIRFSTQNVYSPEFLLAVGLSSQPSVCSSSGVSTNVSSDIVLLRTTVSIDEPMARLSPIIHNFCEFIGSECSPLH